MDILDSRVVVTGGASGIGKALAKAFIKEKSSYVLIVDVDEEKLDKKNLVLLKELLEKHFRYTGSSVAKKILDNWKKETHNFVKVMPTDFKRVLQEMDEQKLKVS